MRALACLLALAAAGAAAPKKPHVEKKDLPVAPRVGELPEKALFGHILIELDEDGVLWVRGKPVNLNQAAAETLRHTEERAKVRKREGKPGMDELRPGVKGSNVVVLLRAHEAVPWRQVQWLMTMLHDQKAYKVEFVARDRRGRVGTVKAWLSLDATTDAGMEITVDEDEEDPPAPGIARLKVKGVGARQRQYGKKEVTVPESVSYAAGRDRTNNPKRVATLLRRALRKSPEKRLELRPEATVPVSAIVPILDVARKEAESVDLIELKLPSKTIRAARPLPWPK